VCGFPCAGQHDTPSQGRKEGCMNNGRRASRMSILRILSAAGKGLTPGALPLAILVTLTVNVCLRWSPNYQPPVGLLRRAALFTAFPLAWPAILEPGPVSWTRAPLAAHLGNAGRLGGSYTRRLRQYTDCRAEASWL